MTDAAPQASRQTTTPGPIALVGSGEFLPQMEEVDRYLLAGRPPRAAFLPTAAGQEGPASVSRWLALGREHYERFRYPDALYQRMQKMVAFAKAQGTENTFIIVPNHADFQRRVREFGLTDQYLEFKRDMSGLGVRVIDYDYVNDITTKRSNYRDPLHSNKEIGSLIANEVFRGPLTQGKLLDASWAGQCSQFLF